MNPELLGEAICAQAYRLCGVDNGMAPPPGGVINGLDKLAALYIETTERRDGPTAAQRATYSSCGDLCHRIAELIGVRAPWVNRASLGQYQVGMNIARLERPGSVPIVPVPAGSICLIWNHASGGDAHAFVALGPGSDAVHLRTANYGAGGMSSATKPGCSIADSPFVAEMRDVTDPASRAVLGHAPTGRYLVGGSRRVLRFVVTPEQLSRLITARINLTGCQVTGELVDALGAIY